MTPNHFLKMVFLYKKNESHIFSGKRIIAKNAGSTHKLVIDFDNFVITILIFIGLENYGFV